MTIKRFHTTMSLGDKRLMTPEGFLVCLDVPMARTGEMLYGPEETPVHSADGVSGVTIRREEDQVFAPDTILSLIGKSVSNDHPEENITPENYKDYEVGTVMSARRGEGPMADLLVGDIIVKDPRAIKDVLDGKIEVSCGYDADYEELKPGLGRQKNIYYNHLALVDKGRCGPRCAIGDYQPEELSDMAKKTRIVVKDKKTLLTRMRQAFMSKDAEAFEKAMDENMGEETDDEVTTSEGTAGMGEVHIHMGGGPGGGTNSRSAGGNDDLPGAGGEDPTRTEPKQLEPEVEARFQGIESSIKQIAVAVQKLAGAGQEEEENAEEMAQEAPPDIGADKLVGAKDSAFFRDSWQETMATAEIIAPGVRVPTFDAAAKPGRTVAAICKFRRTVLDLAYGSPLTRGMLDEVNGGRTLDTSEKCMTCDKVRNTFRSLGLLVRAHNNDAGARDRRVSGTGGAVQSTSGISSIADLNKRNREKYKDIKSA